ncbi:MAG: TIGR04211 family SH3 domain-containing protein [Deltaproteobacteria bacterium]|nr:TIGR04211 family SH3 domain-containing protein [Deltaproteobacteria bacterium]
MKIQHKRIMIIAIFVICLPAMSYAEKMYVTDVLNLTLRSGPSTENKILVMVKSGRQVDILERGEEWSLVKLANEKEGYVLNRYLQPNPTGRIRLEQLQITYDTIKQQEATLLEENTRFKNENEKLTAAIQSNEKMLKKLNGDYKKLKADSAEFLNLKSKHKQISGKLDAQTQRADALDAELSRIENNQYFKWFLAGSGVLLVGFVVGFASKRGRRRSSLL